MSVRAYVIGLMVSFGAAWSGLVLVPVMKMRSQAPIPYVQENSPTAGVFFPKRTGMVANGSQVYAANGCYVCHTQLVRPTYAGTDMYRADWAGKKMDPDRGDTRRETNAYDFLGEKTAMVGLMRIGPDMSNFGCRAENAEVYSAQPSTWLMKHLYDPTMLENTRQSKCPPHPYLFATRKVQGQMPPVGSYLDLGNGKIAEPNAEGKALISYLLSLKKDHSVPDALNFAPKEAE